jgi:hypothetical protein
VNAEQASKRKMRKPTDPILREGRRCEGRRTTYAPRSSAGVRASACIETDDQRNKGSLAGEGA